MVAIVLLFALVGALTWAAGERPHPVHLVIENPASEARAVDVVWTRPTGELSASLLRVVQPSATFIQRIRSGAAACVRWIEPTTSSVRAAWPVGTQRRVHAVAFPGPAGGEVVDRECPPELVKHPIRPRLGRWIRPGEPGKVYRERLISRILHRRVVGRRRVRAGRASGG